MSAAVILAARTAARAEAIAAANACPARILADMTLTPLSGNQRVKISGMATAAEIIAARGVRAAVTEVRRRGPIEPCHGCGRRTRRTEGHRPDCPGRTS